MQTNPQTPLVFRFTVCCCACAVFFLLACKTDSVKKGESVVSVRIEVPDFESDGFTSVEIDISDISMNCDEFVADVRVLPLLHCRQEERVSLSELNPDFDISFGEDYQTSEDFDHNLFFSGMEIVPLETNSDAILGRPRKMIVRNGRYYFHNTQQNCVAGFDETGKQVYSTRPFIDI